MPDMPVADKAKSFWEKPEGKTGMLFAAGGITILVLVMIKWGDILVRAAQNTLVLIGYIIAICIIGYVLMDSRFRATIWFLYKSLMRMFTGFVIQIDPIAILKDYVDDLKENHDKMNTQLGRLRGSMRQLKTQISENEQAARNAMSIAAQAKKTGKAAQVVLKTRRAGRLQDSNRTYQELHNKMEMIYRVLSKMYENCGFLIEDTEDQVKQKEIEWKTIKQASSAMRSAMSIVNGNRDKRAIFEEALDIMATDLSNKIGEMERFMETSQNFMDGIDLQNGVFEERGLEMLEKWEQDADSWLLGSDKSKLIADSSDESKPLDLSTFSGLTQKQETAVRNNQYQNLFDM
jgi:hypothetical protein